MISLLILVVLVVVLVAIAILRGGPPLAVAGFREALDLFLGVAPQLALGFLLGGLISVLIPSEVLGRFIGEGSGLTGLALATIAGILTPGGPFVQFPLGAALARGGAGVGPIAAYLTAWSVVGANRALVWEIPVLGVPFTIARYAVSLLLPFIVGLTVPPLVRLLARAAA